MTTTRPISPFGSFAPCSRNEPLKVTTEQAQFYREFFEKIEQMMLYCNTKLIEKRFLLFSTTWRGLEREEQEQNLAFQRTLAAGQKKLLSKLDPTDPDRDKKIATKKYWDACHLADKEAGRRTQVPLLNESQGFTERRQVRYLTEYASPQQQVYFLNMMKLLEQYEQSPEKISSSELERLHQVSNEDLVQGALWGMRREWALHNQKRIPPRPEPQFHLIDPDLQTAFSALCFEIVGKRIAQEEIDVQIAYLSAYIAFFVDTLRRCLPATKQSSPRMILPVQILTGILGKEEPVEDLVSPRGKSPRAQKPPTTHGIFPFSLPFMNTSKKSVPPPPKPKASVKPVFSSAIAPEEIHFYQGWLTFRELLIKFKRTLDERQRKQTGPSTPPAPILPQKPSLTRETSVANFAARFVTEPSPRRQAISELTVVVDAVIKLVETLLRDLKPKPNPIPPALPTTITPKELFDPQHPQTKPFITALQQLVQIFESIVLQHIRIHDSELPAPMMILFLNYVKEMEEEENKRFATELKGRISKFEQENQELQKENPALYTEKWAMNHFQAVIALAPKSAARQTPKFLKNDLRTFRDWRTFEELLSRSYEGRYLSLSVEELLKRLRAISMREAIRINSGHEKIESLAASPEANAINTMTTFLATEAKKITLPGGIGQDPKKLAAFYKTLAPNQFDVLLINKLFDAFVFLQEIRKGRYFPEDLRSSAPITEETKMEVVASRLKTMQRDLGGGSRIVRNATPPSSVTQSSIPRRESALHLELGDDGGLVSNDVRITLRTTLKQALTLLNQTGVHIGALLKANEAQALALVAEHQKMKEELFKDAKAKQTIEASRLTELQDAEEEMETKRVQVVQEKLLRKTLQTSLSLMQKISEGLFQIPLPKS